MATYDEGRLFDADRLKDLARHARELDPSRGLREMTKVVAESNKRIAARNQRQDMATELALASTAEEFCKRLVRRIVEFEKTLDEKHEVGFRLVSFGQTVTFHARDLQFHNPSLIIFVGVTEQGNPVELIQHVTQISFLLMAVKRLEPDKDRGEFGFHALQREFQEQAAAEQSQETEATPTQED